jgi:hypothetical protein
LRILARLVRIGRANADKPVSVRAPQRSPACQTRWNRRKAAKALGLTIPLGVFAIADEVIE